MNSADSTKNVDETLEVHVYNGRSSNTFDYYEDDGTTFDHENEIFHRRTIAFEPTENQILLKRAAGSYQSKIKKLRLVLHGFEANEMKDAALDLSSEMYRYVNPISHFDPFDSTDRDFLKIKNVLTLETNYVDDEMVFNW